jgi:hypothetical protein
MISKPNEPVDIRHLAEFSSCPNFARYNWNLKKEKEHEVPYLVIRKIILDCYRDLQNLDKQVRYATVRNRVHNAYAPYSGDMSVATYLKKVTRMLEQIRGWYLHTFREGPTTCLINLEVGALVPATGLQVTGGMDIVTVSEPDLVSLIEVTDKFNNKREAFRDFELRSKIYLLKKNNINVSKLSVVNVKGGRIEVWDYKIHDLDSFIYKTEKVMQVVASQIKNDISYPSISETKTN